MRDSNTTSYQSISRWWCTAPSNHRSYWIWLKDGKNGRWRPFLDTNKTSANTGNSISSGRDFPRQTLPGNPLRTSLTVDTSWILTAHTMDLTFNYSGLNNDVLLSTGFPNSTLVALDLVTSATRVELGAMWSWAPLLAQLQHLTDNTMEEEEEE